MKKLLIAALGFAVVSLVACNKTAEKAEENEQDLASKIENCTNPDSMKVYVDQANDYVQKLINEGKTEEAKEYLAKISPVVEEKAPTLAGVFNSVKSAVGEVPDVVSNASDSIASKASEVADSAVSAVKGKAEEAKAKAADAANQATDKVKEKASDAVDQAKDKVNNLFK